MLKRIRASQVRAGMFVEAVEGAWADDPLQQRRFMLNSAGAKSLKDSAASCVVINTSKGIDTISESGGTRAFSGAGLTERRKLEMAVTLEKVQHSAAQLSEIFTSATSGGPVSLDEAASIAKDVSNAVHDNPSVFLSVTRLKSKDETTFLHSVAVSGLMMHFGTYLGLDTDTVEQLGVAGLLHDIGKIEVPGAILNKQGRLDEEEARVIRSHSLMGWQILSRQNNMPEMVLDICLHHHERVDGRGYPDNLSGADLSFFARLAAICDVYDAITSVRPYKKPWSAKEAISWMMRTQGQFDQKLLRKFTLCLAVSAPDSRPSEL